MNRDVIKTIIQTVFPMLLLLLVNAFFKLTFTGYFVICAIALLWSIKQKNQGQYTSWCVVLVASILVTLNYLRPETINGVASYNNAAHNVLVLRGIESSKQLDLVNSSNADVALFDSEDFSGKVTAAPNENGNVDVSCNLISHPVYCWQENSFQVINKNSFPSFSESVEFKTKSGESIKINIEDLDKSTNYIVSTENQGVTVVDTAFFSTRIKEGYPLSDILSTCYKESEIKEEFVSRLKGITLLRNNVPCKDAITKSSPLYFTISGSLFSDYKNGLISVICDGIPVDITLQNSEVQVSENQKIYIGVGSAKTRPLKLSNVGGVVRATYDMPYMYNFPSDTTVISSHTLAISSNAEDLLSSDVRAAFYYDIFNSPTNKNHFYGTVSYQTSSTPNALDADLVDNNEKNKEVENDNLGFRLNTHNKTKWIVDVVDLRSNSPISGEKVWFNDWFILGLIIVLSLFALFFYNIIKEDESIHNAKANGVLNIWLFFISLLTLRLYLMWRVAIFPPVDGISKVEFALYRLENSLSDNSMVWTFGAIAVMMIATIILYVWEKWGNQKIKSNQLCTIYSSKQFWIVLGCVVLASLVNKAVNLPSFVKVLINVVIPVILFFINEWRCIKGLSIVHRVTSAIAVIGMLVIGDAGYAIMFMIFECIYFIILSIAYRHSGMEEPSYKHAVWKCSVVFSILVLPITLFAPQIVCYLYDSTLVLNINFVKVFHIVFTMVAILVAVAILYVIKYLNTKENSKRLKVVLSFVFFLLTIIVILFKSQIIYYFHQLKELLNIDIIQVSHIAFAVIGILLAIAVIYITKDILTKKHSQRLKLALSVCVIAFVIGGPVFFNYMGHFKYRSLIHTQNVGQIMEHEDVSTRNSQRLLEASQNQWFLQYHNDLGKERILDDGVMHLYPHFKKGVSWNTQISDVICSRYIVGELSLIVPLALIILCFILLYSTLKHENESSTGYAYSVGVALLILIQMTFVWMANTNRMIFFGQDLPFLSHNAHSTMLMFALLLALIMFALGNNGEDESDELSSGFKHFSARPFKLMCMLFFVIFGVVFFTGNKYDNLYGGKAEAYTVGHAMDVAEADFVKINGVLSKFRAKERLYNNQDLKTHIIPSIESSISLSAEVEKMYKDKDISEFSYSLYKSFINNNCKANRLDNVVHLRYLKSSGTYQFALNNGFYCLKAPEMDKHDWSGDIYAYQKKETVIKLQNPDQGNGIYLYSIPRTWLKDKDNDYAIFYNGSDGSIKPVLFNENGRTNVSVPTIYMTSSDVVRCKVKDKSFIYQVSGKKEDLLAKNMTINGSSKFFYPLGDKFYWAKNFADYENNNINLNGKQNCNLSFDKDLTSEVYKICGSLSKIPCSVIAMDGLGNVRLMIDNNSHPNPNSPTEIEKFVENSYLNPNYESDSRIFGNMNLVHMMPGPGSSLKPITYAAVTSQIKTIDWGSLKLRRPNIAPSAIKDKKTGKTIYRYEVDKFGPYDYSSRPFVSIPSDEVGKDGWVDSDFYLYKSSNYYNALITYLGYFKLSDYNNLSNILKAYSGTADEYPVVQMNGRTYTLNVAPDKNRHQCILNTGLKQNFQMSVSHDDKSDIKTILSDAFVTPNTKVSNYPWLFPQVSSVYTTESRGLSEEQRLRQYTLGASPLKVTPIMMAEMYGRLFSMHPDYHANVIENNTSFNSKWSDPNLFSFYKTNLFVPMNHCSTFGTASVLQRVKHDGYYLYAKTGTLLGDGSNRDDKMLAVIITNKDVSQAQSPDDYKFFVVYFRFKQAHDMPGEVVNIMNKIIQSKSFQDYM